MGLTPTEFATRPIQRQMISQVNQRNGPMRKIILLALFAFSSQAFAVNDNTSLNDIQGKWCNGSQNKRR
jgi:hypothetical protein